MKRLFAVILCLCLLAGCGRAGTGDTRRAAEGSEGSPASSVAGDSGEKAAPIGGLFRVIRSEDGAPLLLAKADGGPVGVYTLSPEDVEVAVEGGAAMAKNGVYTGVGIHGGEYSL